MNKTVIGDKVPFDKTKEVNKMTSDENMRYEVWVYKKDLDKWELEEIMSNEKDAENIAKDYNKDGFDTVINPAYGE